MQNRLNCQESTVEGDAPRERSRRNRHRGVTSMEYCVMASFILLVLIASVQAFGFKVGSLFASNAAATSKISPPGP